MVIAERDTLKEVTVITIDRNEAGDTVRVSSVTDRTRASSRNRVRDVGVKVVERTDTVYVERRDSVSSSSTSEATKSMTKFKVSGDSLGPRPSTLILTLKWMFAVICAVGVLIMVIKVKCSG